MSNPIIFGPPSNDSRSPLDTERNRFLVRTASECFFESFFEIRNCLFAKEYLRHIDPTSAGINDEAEAEKVKAIADVGNVRLFHRQFQTAVGSEKVADLVAEAFGILSRTSCDKDTPIVCVACEPNVRSSSGIAALPVVAVHALAMKEPVQLVQDRVGQKR